MLAPSRAARSAIDLPMPRLAPVMKSVLPASDMRRTLTRYARSPLVFVERLGLVPIGRPDARDEDRRDDAGQLAAGEQVAGDAGPELRARLLGDEHDAADQADREREQRDRGQRDGPRDEAA